jgi:hypothetical protein
MNQDVINQLLHSAPYYILKLIIVTLLFLHFLYSLVVLKQTKTMLKVIEAQISPGILVVSTVYFILSLVLLVISIIII